MKKFKLPKFNFRKFLRLLIAFVIGCNILLMIKNATDGDINVLMLRLSLIIWMGLYLILENRINDLMNEREEFENFLTGCEERIRTTEGEIQGIKDEISENIVTYKNSKESRF